MSEIDRAREFLKRETNLADTRAKALIVKPKELVELLALYGQERATGKAYRPSDSSGLFVVPRQA